jgi:hypothetical protein
MKSAIRPLGPAIGSRPGSIGRPRPQGVPRVVGPVNIPSIKVTPVHSTPAPLSPLLPVIPACCALPLSSYFCGSQQAIGRKQRPRPLRFARPCVCQWLGASCKQQQYRLRSLSSSPSNIAFHRMPPHPSAQPNQAHGPHQQLQPPLHPLPPIAAAMSPPPVRTTRSSASSFLTSPTALPLPGHLSSTLFETEIAPLKSFAFLTLSGSGRSDGSGFISLRPQSFMDRQQVTHRTSTRDSSCGKFRALASPLTPTQGMSSGPYAQHHREIERPMESYRSSRRHEDEHHDQQHGRMQYQQQRYPPPPSSSDRYDSRRAPSPSRQQQQQQQQQQHRQTSDDTNRRVSSGSTHDWADDDDGEMNFNEPLLIVSNRSVRLLQSQYHGC